MKAEEYLSFNQKVIRKECQTIIKNGSNAIITIKDNGNTYFHKVSMVEEFMAQLPDNKFFQQMRNGINNAIKHRVVPIVIFESQKARMISLPDDFPQKL